MITEPMQGVNPNKKRGSQVAAVGAVLIAASIILPMLGVLQGTPITVMLLVGVVIGVVGMVMSRTGTK